MDRLSLTLLAAGVIGVLLMLLYQRACSWADWELMPSRVRRRVHTVERRAPVLLGGAGTVALVGLALVLVDGLT